MLRNYINRCFYQQLKKNLVEHFGIKTPLIQRNLKYLKIYLGSHNIMKEVQLLILLTLKLKDLVWLTQGLMLLILEQSLEDLLKTRELFLMQ
jgi:hypothetical protein